MRRKILYGGSIALLIIISIPLWNHDIADVMLECNEITKLDKLMPDLVQELGEHPNRKKNWEALYHHDKYLDGYYSVTFARRCFLLFFNEKPMILFEHYEKTRDPRILKLLQDLICNYSPDLWFHT